MTGTAIASASVTIHRLRLERDRLARRLRAVTAERDQFRTERDELAAALDELRDGLAARADA